MESGPALQIVLAEFSNMRACVGQYLPNMHMLLNLAFFYQKFFKANKGGVSLLSYFIISIPHREFPGGPPSKYYLGPTMLNFSDLTRTGGSIVVWWYSERGECICINMNCFLFFTETETWVINTCEKYRNKSKGKIGRQYVIILYISLNYISKGGILTRPGC